LTHCCWGPAVWPIGLEAEKVEFVSLPLELIEGTDGLFHFPPVTEVEQEAWWAGLVALPAPLSWYEFRSPDSAQMGLLIEAYKDDWLIRHLAVDDGDILSDGLTTRLFRFRTEPGEGPEVTLYGPALSIEMKQKTGIPIEAGAWMALYLTLMIGSRSTVLSTIAPAEKLNVSRTKKGLAPLPGHRVVRVVPEEFIRASREESGHAARLPPRLHWRRSHIRHLSDDRKTLIPRCLVGRPESGTVSHEYRIG
jgi:hypothetical protein